MPDICVMGLGYVGLPTASLLATAGYHVLGVDVSSRIIAALQSGTTHMKEAGLATLVSAAHHSGNLVGAEDPQPADTFMLCVPTPVCADHSVDLSMVEEATRRIAPLLKSGNLVVLESTSPVGTTRKVVGRIIREHGLEPGKDVHLCYCPERVLPGNTVAELVNNDRIIGGISQASAEHAHEIYARFCQGNISLTDDLTAEMSKLMENTFRDVNIAVANVFARIAEDAGVNAWEAIGLANRHPRVNILSPGPGVGGHCIPVDPWFFVHAYPQHAALLKVARETNDGQAQRLLDRMIETGMKSSATITVLGAAYKADIDDARESPAHLFVTAAESAGFEVRVHDPLVEEGTRHGMTVTNNLDAALKDTDAAVLLTDHKVYRTLAARKFEEQMRGRLIADGKNWLNHAALRRAGFTVLALGQGQESEQTHE